MIAAGSIAEPITPAIRTMPPHHVIRRLIDDLIDSGRAVELEWREDPSICVDEIGALVSRPDGALSTWMKSAR